VLHRGGIAYDWQGKALGGFRKGGYDGHMRTPEFVEAASALRAPAERVCIMCAETRPAQAALEH
jgi:hypothetical protein